MGLFNVEEELMGYTVDYKIRKVVFTEKILMHFKYCFF